MKLSKHEQKVIETELFYKVEFAVEKPLFFPYYTMDFSLCSAANEKILGIRSSLAFAYGNFAAGKGLIRWYTPKKEMDNFSKLQIERFQKPEYFEKISGLIAAENRKLQAMASLLESYDPLKVDPEKVLELYQSYVDALVHFRVFAYIPNLVSLGEITLIGEYRKLLSVKVTNEEFAQLTDFEQLTEETRAEKELLLMIAENRNEENSIKKWIHEFAYLYYYYTGPLPSVADVRVMMKSMDQGKQSALKRIVEIEHYTQNVQENKKRLIKKLSLTKQDIHLLHVVAYFNFYKAKRKELMQKSYVAADCLFSKFESLTGLNVDDLKLLTVEETARLLKSKNKALFVDLAKQRKKEYFMMNIPQGMQVTSNQPEIEKIIKAIKCFVPTRKLMVACAGNTVTGKMVVINTKADMKKIEKIKEPFILASNSTYPDLLPAMAKAAGIITKIGGMTSHAAIVSREMGKPCIVGYTDLFEQFEEGDRVELNSHEAVVVKLRKPKGGHG